MVYIVFFIINIIKLAYCFSSYISCQNAVNVIVSKNMMNNSFLSQWVITRFGNNTFITSQLSGKQFQEIQIKLKLFKGCKRNL
jgi:hypothetical protein